MKKIILLLTLSTPFFIYWFFQIGGSDPTMDYSSLQGSGISPREYDDLVKQRQTQYVAHMKEFVEYKWIVE